MQLQHQLKHHFPNLKTHGMNHPATDQNLMISKVIGWGQMAGFGLMLFGQPLFQMLNKPVPDMVQYMSDNKLNTFSMLFVASFFSTQLHATGAFEIIYNGQVLHSKLESGRICDVGTLVRALEEAGVRKASDSSLY